MESLLQMIVFLVFIRFLCRVSFFTTMWKVVALALLTAVISYSCYPFVIKQSGGFYTKLLSDSTLVGNVAVVITLESIAGMFLSIGLLNTLFKGIKKSKFDWLRYFPDILIVGAVIYVEQQVFYAFPGYDFKLTAIFSAIFFAGGVYGLALLIRWALPEKSGRYEFNFLINIFLLIVAIFLNAGLSSYNTANYESGIAWQSTAVFLGLMALLFGLGFILYQLNWKNKKFRKILRWI